MRILLASCALAAAALLHAQNTETLPIRSWRNVEVAEPSDVAIASATTFYTVSDQGRVATIDSSGHLLRLSGEVGYDLEGCLYQGGRLYVADERARRILELDPNDLTVKRRLTFPYGGGRNKGYEAIGWNERKQVFTLITERDPVTVYEVDTAWRIVNEVPFDRSVRDLSGCSWYNGSMWMLSDMDRELLRCDPVDYHILQRYSIPVINPEGLSIAADGTAWVMSDDRQRLYTFQLPR